MADEPNKESAHLRVVVYVPERKHRALRSKLAMRGLSVSEWFRRMVDKILRE